ncbi:INACTIVE LEUCINE-RICH REPEAT RECEPTOR-LIKE PROTEIN KINASE CORYNE [Salix viminalis]|uniref:INACTIVE LEUCINE-RICH REPEAT RECEPTOR-LIKE PROTEIN KINASE CORYNE n=1 Tax=Salix viminalis TaxID=40686 RepID=A0A9Q0TL39_SALVM|nr:INACTIVE LEUCINE-RICH REPEAT RECEPTOR-LIKE PROTEIN KINASE CORYNE [Salix viminalis]
MGKRRYRTQISNSKDTSSLLFLSILCLYYTSAHCQESRKVTPPFPSTPTHSKNGLERILVSIFLGVLTGLTGAVVFAFVVRFLVRYLKRTPILKGPVIFSPKITPKSLQSALENENQLLGSSSNGKYYRTVLDNGLTIAVKRFEPFEIGSPERQSKSVKRRIQQELEMLASLRHRNLMSLRAYVREPDRFSLVYDCVPTGSLEDAMNRILHYNLKPRNVILDAEFEPRLTDFGLAKLTPNLDRATSGYSAPECFQNCRYTDKSDVFSFGMILGVLLTGRDPTDPFFGETASGGSLGPWLRHLQQAGEAREALDKSILGEEVEEDEMLMAVRIAVVCLSDMPADRPSSDELVPMLSQLHSF